MAQQKFDIPTLPTPVCTALAQETMGKIIVPTTSDAGSMRDGTGRRREGGEGEIDRTTRDLCDGTTASDELSRYSRVLICVSR